MGAIRQTLDSVENVRRKGFCIFSTFWNLGGTLQSPHHDKQKCGNGGDSDVRQSSAIRWSSRAASIRG